MQTQIAWNRFLTHSVMRSLTDGAAMFRTHEKDLKEPWSVVELQGETRSLGRHHLTLHCASLF